MRTPVFTDSLLDSFRTQLSTSPNVAGYWRRLPRFRLIALLATTGNPEYAQATHGSLEAAVMNLVRDASVPLEAATIIASAESIWRLLSSQDGTDVESFTDPTAFLVAMDERLETKLSELAGQPLVIVARGLSGSGKSGLASAMRRAGFRGIADVGLMNGDDYLSRVGRDPKVKQTAYQTESGEIVLADPIHADDPIAKVEPLLWHNEFKHNFASLAEDHRVIVVDGGYGDLILNKIDVPAAQRLNVETYVDSNIRYQRAKRRAEQSQAPDRVAARVMNDIVVSMAWFTFLNQRSSPPNFSVSTAEALETEALVAQRAQTLGVDAKPVDFIEELRVRFNVARDPKYDRVSGPGLQRMLERLFDVPAVQDPAAANQLSVVHKQLPPEFRERLTIPQLQLVIAHYRNHVAGK